MDEASFLEAAESQAQEPLPTASSKKGSEPWNGQIWHEVSEPLPGPYPSSRSLPVVLEGWVLTGSVNELIGRN